MHINDGVSNIELKGIYKILNKEVEAKEENNKLYNVKVAGFPFLRTLDEYDFSFQPSIKEERIRAIIESDFYEKAENIVFIGNQGTGKTHLVVSIVYSVAIRRNLLNSINLFQYLKVHIMNGHLKKLKQFFK